MTISTEDRMLSDLSELQDTCRGDGEDGNQEVTQDPDLLRALLKMAARCAAAWTALVEARTAYSNDQTENKVVALQFAEAFARCLEERRWLLEALTAKLLQGRAWAALSEDAQVERKGWVESTFPHTPTALVKIAQKDAIDAFAQTLARVSGAGSLATQEEWSAFGASVGAAQQAYAALVRERLDDKPISDRLKAAFANASAQRVGARSILQGVLASEGSAWSINDLLKRRKSRSKPAPAPAPSPTTPAPTTPADQA